MSEKLQADVYLNVINDSQSLGTDEQTLIEKAKMACDTSYAPYSKFSVGAALLLENGEIISGSNQENAAYPSGLCAERVAIFAASAAFPKTNVKKIAIAARKSNEHGKFVNVTPCGACRQVMSEYETRQDSPIKVLMLGDHGKIFVSNSVDVLLPFKFSDTSLK